HPQLAASAVGRHGVRQMLELSCYDDGRRLPPVRGRDRVVDAPGGTAASVAQPDDRDVYLVGERVELGERLLAFVTDSPTGEPRANVRADILERGCPLVDHPLPRAPRRIPAEPNRLSGER